MGTIHKKILALGSPAHEFSVSTDTAAKWTSVARTRGRGHPRLHGLW
jgi:hypothetical protein